jgi:hypothetical protein
VDRAAALLGSQAQGIWTGAVALGCAEDRRNGVTASEKGFEDGLAKILLADDGDFHLFTFVGVKS